jgi:cytidine deaminase
MNETEEAMAVLYAPARLASENAYSPYSGVKVGASLIDENGDIYSGCNVENASYGLTQCAERNALSAAITAGVKPGSAHTMLIFATGFEVVAPCGACRQVMSELMADDAVIITCRGEGDDKRWTVGELLPDSFVLKK